MALAHVAAVERMESLAAFESINIGCGLGVTVYEVVNAFKSASGAQVPIEVVGRRQGDLPAFWADAKLAESRLGWKPLSALPMQCA